MAPPRSNAIYFTTKSWFEITVKLKDQISRSFYVSLSVHSTLPNSTSRLNNFHFFCETNATFLVTPKNRPIPRVRRFGVRLPAKRDSWPHFRVRFPTYKVTSTTQKTTSRTGYRSPSPWHVCVCVSAITFLTLIDVIQLLQYFFTRVFFRFFSRSPAFSVGNRDSKGGRRRAVGSRLKRVERNCSRGLLMYFDIFWLLSCDFGPNTAGMELTSGVWFAHSMGQICLGSCIREI